MKTTDFETHLEKIQSLESNLKEAEKMRTKLMLSMMWSSELEQTHEFMKTLIYIEKSKIYN